MGSVSTFGIFPSFIANIILLPESVPIVTEFYKLGAFWAINWLKKIWMNAVWLNFRAIGTASKVWIMFPEHFLNIFWTFSEHFLNVITSYSIHYTKLYDAFLLEAEKKLLIDPFISENPKAPCTPEELNPDIIAVTRNNFV